MNASSSQTSAPISGGAYRAREAALVLVVMIAASVTLNLVFAPLPQVTDPVRRTFGITDVQFSLLVGLFTAIPSMAMSVGGGWLCDRLPRRALLIVAMTLWTVGGLWSALASSYEQLAASRVLIAAAAGVKFPLAITWINDAFPAERRGRAVGAFFVVLGIGPAIGASLAGIVLQASEAGRFVGVPLLGTLEPWRVALVLLALTNVVVIPCVLLLHDRRLGMTEETAAERGDDPHVPTTLVIAVVVAVSLLGLADSANLAWLPTVLRRQYGFDAQSVGFTFGIVTTIGGIVGSLAGGFVGDWVYRRNGTSGRLWVCAAAALLSALLIAAYAGGNVRVLVAALVFNAVSSVMAMTLGYVAFQALLPAGRRGFGIGLGGAVATLASSAGPTLVASVSARLPEGSGSLALGIAAVTCNAFVVAALLYVAVAWRIGRGSTRGVAPAPATIVAAG